MNEAVEMMKKKQMAHAIHRTMLMKDWKIGTKMIEQVCATNCPAHLQIATANLILEQQQRRTIRRIPASPRAVYPIMVY